MTLEEKLKRLKQIEAEKTESDWEKYKLDWVEDVRRLQETIMSKWFGDYEADQLMIFSLIPIKRLEPHIGEYTSSTLEITLSNNKILLLEPIASLTTEYDGKLEFSMLGNIYKSATILRKLSENNSCEWVIATSYQEKDHRKLTKTEIETLIEKWLY